ncbi:hypothetical protein QTP88_007903 [Uroleucon formosanum]
MSRVAYALKVSLRVPQTSKDCKEVANGFKDRWQMINCGGCIDGKHIRICQPARSGALYYNYKNFYSIVLMAIVNHNYELIYVDVGKQGRISDGGVIQATTFYRRLQNETLNLPKPMDCEEDLNVVFIGDAAFSIEEHVLKPFPQKSLNYERRIYNYRLSRARNVVENAFGLIANLHSSSNEYVCDQSRPCTSNEQYLDTNDTLVISGMSNDVCDRTLVEKTVINADKKETHNNRRKYYRYIGDFSEEDLETPRRRKLFWNTHTKILDEKNQKKRLLEQKNRRLESKISSLNTLVDELKKECQLNASYSHILKNIGTEEEKQLLMRQLQISTGKSICPILRKFAMTLHFYSPSAYSYVRTIFSKALPDVSTIRKWYSKLDGLPGMTKESFQAISLKVKEMKVNGKQLYGCLVMDEMSIKQHVHWTGTRHQGYIDFGLGGKTEEMDNLPYAKDAFVIMVVGMNTSWKVPIAYYFINGISAEEKANIILNCLQELDTTGIIIKTLTFDGAANNLSMASELGANLQYSELKPYFLHPNTNDKIHIILDPCHVVKLLRNCLGDWKILYTTNGETIKWSYFKNLVNLQNESGLHSATKLRNRHIYYFREKMKVKLAVQTFSTSVANAILFCMNDLKLDNFQGADATIEFCLRINNIFDIINTRNFLSKGTYNKSINKRTKTEIVHYIEESIDYLAGGFNAMKNQQNVVSCQY